MIVFVATYEQLSIARCAALWIYLSPLIRWMSKDGRQFVEQERWSGLNLAPCRLDKFSSPFLQADPEMSGEARLKMKSQDEDVEV